MQNDTVVASATIAPESAPATSTEEFSLAAYRASREGAAAAAGAEDDAPAADDPNSSEASPADKQSGDESAADSETAEDSEQAELSAEANPKKGKGGFQKRISKLTGERDALRGELEVLKAQLAGNKEPAAKPTEAAKPAEPQFEKAKPKLEEYDSLETFTEALTDWKAEERDFKRAEADRTVKAQAEGQKALDAWKTREADAKAKHADYEQALEAVSDIRLSPAHQRAIFESEMGPELAYQLAKDPEELKRIAALSPLAAARALGAFEAQIAPVRKPATKVSGAPAPIRPVGGKSPVVAADASTSDYRAYRAARESGRLR